MQSQPKVLAKHRKIKFPICQDFLLLGLQAELPEEDMDVRGGGRDAEMERVTRDDGYGSDNEVDSRTNASWSAQRISIGSQPPKNRSIAAIQSQASHAVSFLLPRHELVHEWRLKIVSLFV